MSHDAHILIVDDEPNVRLVFRTALESDAREPRGQTYAGAQGSDLVPRGSPGVREPRGQT